MLACVIGRRKKGGIALRKLSRMDSRLLLFAVISLFPVLGDRVSTDAGPKSSYIGSDVFQYEPKENRNETNGLLLPFSDLLFSGFRQIENERD